MIEKILEVRFYNGVIEGFDTDVVYQANFVLVVDENMHGKKTQRFALEITGGIRKDDGKPNRWVESNKTWLRKWFPQIMADVKAEPVCGWRLK